MVRTKYTDATGIGIEWVAGRWRHMDLRQSPPEPIGPAFRAWHEISGEHKAFLQSRGFEISDDGATSQRVTTCPAH